MYYRALKGTGFKWLDLGKFVRRALGPKYDVIDIYYFTARIAPVPHDPSRHIRQNKMIEAIEVCEPALKVVYGQYQAKPKLAELPGPDDSNTRDYVDLIKIKHVEEKGSDVNLAVTMLNDAWSRKEIECFAIFSGDSDLLPAIEKVQDLKKKVLVVDPSNNVNSELVKTADMMRHLKVRHLEQSQMPDEIVNGKSVIKKPSHWTPNGSRAVKETEERVLRVTRLTWPDGKK